MAAYEELVGARVYGGLTSYNAGLLKRVVEDRRPEHCLEIGMANGVSSLAILEHLPPAGDLVSIDPNQSTQWSGAGLRNVRNAGLAERHRIIESPDFLALPRLVEAGETFDLVFIDGWHSFEYVLLDLFYADLLLRTGGVVGFDDCDMAATRKALRFLLSHRPYREVRLGPPRFTGSNPVKTALRFAMRWPVQDRWFEKERAEQTEWNVFHRF